MSRRLPGEAAIRALASPEVFERGRAYSRDGSVSELVARGPEITAAVAGSDVEPYRVTVRIEGGRIGETRCTCPYEWGGACKHVVATLLALVEAPDAVAERPTLEQLLEPFGRDALADLLVRRAALDPDLAGWIEADLATTIHPGHETGKIDPKPVAERARALLGARYRRDDYWDDYRPHGNAAELRALVEKAVPILEAGDGRNALRLLEAVADPLIEDWLDYGHVDDEETYLLFADLGRMMAEAVLMSDLGPAERESLSETLQGWEDGLSDYGPEGFSVAIRALETGWDDPALEAVLDGGPGPWPPEDADDLEDLALTDVMLRVLDGCGRDDAYLNLARAAGAHTRLAAKLVRLGRVAEAVAHASDAFTSPAESLDLAQVLDAAGRRGEALRVAEVGLALPSEPVGAIDGMDPRRPGHTRVPLARWLREAATGDLALRAARAAFAETLSIDDFHAAETTAGAAWDTIRPDLLDRLRTAEQARDRAEIFLEAGMIAEAVAGVRRDSGYGTNDAVLLRLMEAAHASHPDWVIAFAETRAAVIMDGGSAGLYAEAAEWLKRAAMAYDAAGRIDAWSVRIEGLIETHKRKYKLRPMLEALRFGG